MSTTTPTYRILTVPHTTPRLPDLILKARATRLHALSTDPTSFIATHEVESRLPLSVWGKRIASPGVRVVVCVAIPPSSPPSPSTGETSEDTSPGADDEEQDDTEDEEEIVSLLLAYEWISTAALRGPMAYETYYANTEMQLSPPPRPETETRWHLYDLYTLPAHRGRGVGKRMVGECVRVAISLSNSLGLSAPDAPEKHGNSNGNSDTEIDAHTDTKTKKTHARLRLFTNPRNTWLVAMYHDLGFADAGRVTLLEAFEANGMLESVPADVQAKAEGTDTGRWHLRFGVAMERRVCLDGGA